MNHFTLGLDLGQAHDFTALAILQRHHRKEEGGRRPTHYEVRHLEHHLGKSYPGIVDLVLERIRALLAAGATVTLVVDYTGVGRPVMDMLRAARLPGYRLVPLAIHGGQAVSGNRRNGFSVPKRDLVGCLTVALQSDRLKVAAGLPLAQTLADELLNFRVKISAAGRDTYGAGSTNDDWRDGAHDDLVLAVAIALWHAENAPRPVPGILAQAVVRRQPPRYHGD